MVVNRKVTGKASSMPAGLAIGAAVSIGATLALSVVVGWLVYAGQLKEGHIGYCAMGILLLSSLLGAVVSKGKIKRQLLAVCGASGLIYYAVLLMTTALFSGGEYRGMGVTALMVLCGCAIGALPGVRRGRGVRTGRGRRIRR